MTASTICMRCGRRIEHLSDRVKTSSGYFHLTCELKDKIEGVTRGPQRGRRIPTGDVDLEGRLI